MSTETAELTIEQRVAAGAAYLDDIAPDWHVGIDLDRLDIERPCNCVLGQLFGSYGDSPRAARWDADNEFIGAERGFEAEYWFGYDDLTSAWRRLIESRRAAVE